VERKSGSRERRKNYGGRREGLFFLFDVAFALPDFYVAGLAKLGGFA